MISSRTKADDMGQTKPGKSGKSHKIKKIVREVIEIKWSAEAAFCSEKVRIQGKTKDCQAGYKLAIQINDKDAGKKVAKTEAPIAADAFNLEWSIVEVLPPKKDGHYITEQKLAAIALKKEPEKTLALKHVPTLPNTEYKADRVHFHLSAVDYSAKIESELTFVKGWGGSVVKLGASVPNTTGGVIAGLTWPGYRWMKQVGVKNKYWDGSAWQDLPATFSLNDSNNFCVGFYKSGTKYTSQYGGDWPESFADWDIDASAKKKKVKKWKDNIEKTWSGKFHLKRKECVSHSKDCCKYELKTEVTFTQLATFTAGTLIIADGNIRSNDSLFFLDETRIAMAAHEFGHHLGNPDEYAGATLDTSLNDDGAVNGIDDDSLMGQNLTKVKKRHFRTICKHFTDMVKTKTGKTFTYEAVK